MTDELDRTSTEVDMDHAAGAAGCDAFGRGMMATRRRFASAGLAAPILLTLANRPAWAGSCSESGRLSGNLSNQEPCVGEGCSPGFWGRSHHLKYWHHNYPPDAKFQAVFDGVDWFGPGATLLMVINMQAPVVNLNGCTSGGPPWNPNNVACKQCIIACGMQAVAALQNAATEVKYPFPPRTMLSGHDPAPGVIDQVKGAWNSGNVGMIEDLKDLFDALNNQGCKIKDGPGV